MQLCRKKPQGERQGNEAWRKKAKTGWWQWEEVGRENGGKEGREAGRGQVLQRRDVSREGGKEATVAASKPAEGRGGVCKKQKRVQGMAHSWADQRQRQKAPPTYPQNVFKKLKMHCRKII